MMDNTSIDILKKDLKSGKYDGVKVLKMNGMRMRDIPEEVQLVASTVEVLDLADNDLECLPSWFGCFVNVKVLFFLNNKFKSIPPVLSQLKSLYMISFKNNALESIHEDALPLSIGWLIFTNNKLSCLPESIGYLKDLRKCMLAGNQLKTLPDTMKNCKQLELLRIASNKLNPLPEWISSHSSLSWVAFAGNGENREIDLGNVRRIQKDEITLFERVGEGASGMVYKGKWGDRVVAVKEFKGSMTSDGSTSDELTALLFVAAHGGHDHIINVCAVVGDQVEAVVMDYIDLSSWTILGDPPTFDTVTRDVYAERRFKLAFTVKVLTGVADAMRFLHSIGLLHGDLYAHNILVDAEGGALLGDFGASSFIGENDSVKKLEVRAFGCLIEELVERTDEMDSEVRDVLLNIRDDCFVGNVMERPSFDELVVRLEGVSV